MNDALGSTKLKPIALIVLGPHRSGTSALTGIIGQIGANLPKHLMPANDGNSAGYFESSRIKSFNDRLLSEIGSSWHNISPIDLASIPAQVRECLLDEAVELLKAEFGGVGIPLLKDPRICRLVGFWREAFDRFGYRPIYIHTHRNPLETARSLAARHPISVEMGALIWLRHVLDAEAATRNEPRAFTNYRTLLENWRGQVSQIEAASGFDFPQRTPAIERKIDGFLSKDLRHQSHQPEDVNQSPQVSDLVQKAFGILEGWTHGQGNPADYRSLDRLRMCLDGSIGTITPFVQAMTRERLRLVEEAEAERLTLHEEIRGRDDTVWRLEANISERFSEIASISEMMLKTGQQLARARARHAETKKANAQLKKKSDQLAAELDRSRQEVENSRKRIGSLIASSSWRITGPLRRFTNLIRRYN